ncbi:biotin/lipoyl-binding protein [Acuticoccus sp. MNP-M23]|uniref:HlyD family secretion protein n=1 Tax=Acuticoccus sp. MNP-M23 TaxID=3072793 RepID=UPI0028155EEB|nr:biotin/lipoyl-binding protein [Acuticoccus sp. MNP-M23]WMS43456.1 biotin/lipoyl-binding protein [Acuticoccus sp. MNP-M23]
MIEILVTSIPFWLRVLYLRWRGMPITLYNLHRALFLWLVLALIVFFAVFYYHPKSYSGVVPFRIVPVVAERGGTVTAVMVEVGQRVEPGEVLFTTDDSQELAAVEVAQRQLEEIESAASSANAQVRAAQATVDQASAALKQASASLADQEELRSRNSSAFRENEYERLTNTVTAREAEVAAATALLETAQLEVTERLPARRESANATLAQAQVELDHTNVRSSVAGTIQQLTLNVGARAGQTNLGPAMLIVPDGPLQITAGFAQAARSVLHTGMAAEVVCYSRLNVMMTDAVLPARIVRIQNVIAAGQIAPTGQLLEPSSVANEGDVVVNLALEYPEHEALLPRGSSCIVQTYTTHLSGPLEGGLVSHAVEAMGVIKAVLLRTKAWTALVTGVGLGGGGH